MVEGLRPGWAEGPLGPRGLEPDDTSTNGAERPTQVPDAIRPGTAVFPPRARPDRSRSSWFGARARASGMAEVSRLPSTSYTHRAVGLARAFRCVRGIDRGPLRSRRVVGALAGRRAARATARGLRAAVPRSREGGGAIIVRRARGSRYSGPTRPAGRRRNGVGTPGPLDGGVPGRDIDPRIRSAPTPAPDSERPAPARKTARSALGGTSRAAGRPDGTRERASEVPARCGATVRGSSRHRSSIGRAARRSRSPICRGARGGRSPGRARAAGHPLRDRWARPHTTAAHPSGERYRPGCERRRFWLGEDADFGIRDRPAAWTRARDRRSCVAGSRAGNPMPDPAGDDARRAGLGLLLPRLETGSFLHQPARQDPDRSGRRPSSRGRAPQTPRHRGAPLIGPKPAFGGGRGRAAILVTLAASSAPGSGARPCGLYLRLSGRAARAHCQHGPVEWRTGGSRDRAPRYASPSRRRIASGKALDRTRSSRSSEPGSDASSGAAGPQASRDDRHGAHDPSIGEALGSPPRLSRATMKPLNASTIGSVMKCDGGTEGMIGARSGRGDWGSIGSEPRRDGTHVPRASGATIHGMNVTPSTDR